MDKTISLSPEGYKDLQNELEQLATVERPAMVRHVEEARVLGDLRENEAYQAARSKLGLIQGRIEELQHILLKANVSENNTNITGMVQVGSTVTLEVDDAVKLFRVVHEHEADIQNGKISVDSPIGKGVLGRRIGDTIEVEVPAGTRSYKITRIE